MEQHKIIILLGFAPEGDFAQKASVLHQKVRTVFAPKADPAPKAEIALTFLYGGRSTLGAVMEYAGTRLLRIRELARLSGLAVNTLLYYEQRNLLKPAARSEAGHRLYGQEEVARLQFIKRAKLAGLTLAEAKELLALITEGERGENIPRLKGVLEEKIRETERRMEELAAFRDSLLHYRQRAEQKEDEGKPSS